MSSEKSIIVKRDCPAVMIPSGETTNLAVGSCVWLTQALGGAYTVMTDRGYMVRIDGIDGDAIGMAQVAEFKQNESTAVDDGGEVEKHVWDQLRSCFDPEIPVNIVELMPSSARCSLKKRACCNTSGFVGARITTLAAVNIESRPAATSSATMVLPNPVGRTTSVFDWSADLAIVLWYSRVSIPIG